MALSANIPEIVEYRGVWGLVAAEVLTDDDTSGYTTGDVFAIAATSEISKSVDGSSEAHYYNNVPAVVIDSEGPDTITIQAAAIPLEVQAEISGQQFDSATSAWMDREVNGLYSVEDTAIIETWYRPDIKADCRIVLLESGDVYEVLGKPEDIELRHQFLKFKVHAVEGDA